MALWLFAHDNVLTVDIFTIWLPATYVPMTLISWVILNVTSIVVPFDLSSDFYRRAYALPAHEIYQIFADIWSWGCNPQLHYALCIPFAYEISGLILSGLGVHRRCHYAVIAQEIEKAAFQSHLDAALASERRRDLERDTILRQVPLTAEGINSSN